MPAPEKIDIETVRAALPAFKEKTIEFVNGDLSKKDYKGFSGKYGSYSQRDGKSFMLRLRMTAGQITKDKLQFVIDECNKHDVNLAHFTTCQALQLHNLLPEDVFAIMEDALEHDIITYGGGGDYPRNVMNSPLSGVEKDEYFDTLPYAMAAADFLMHYIDTPKMPRKLKVAFSNSPANRTHATFRDLGFVARENGNFDVYAAGGLGAAGSRLGALVLEDVPGKDLLYVIRTMIEFFREHGNYAVRAKARTRFMQDSLGGPEAFAEAFRKAYEKTKAAEDLDLEIEVPSGSMKQPDGQPEKRWNVIEQKQPGLYALLWHPVGGSPDLQVLEQVNDAIQEMEDVQLRLSPDESVYIINLTGKELDRLQAIIDKDNARNVFETSVGCIGASICQVGVRDSQDVLRKSIEAVRAAGIPDDALPQIHISGCPSSCGTHQIGTIGFRGGVKMVDKKPVPGFTLFLNGKDEQGKEVLAKEVGAVALDQVPDFMVTLGKKVAASGRPFEAWLEENPDGLAEVAAAFTA